MHLGSFARWQTSHVRRTANEAAHRLAKLATTSVMDRSRRDESPECIFDIVQVENNVST